eukprot:1568550-Amphidinium_carterae.6
MVTERSVVDRTQNEQDVGSGPTDVRDLRAPTGNTRLDPLKLGRPPVFAGDEATYEDWAFKFKTFIGQESTTAVKVDTRESRRDGKCTRRSGLSSLCQAGRESGWILGPSQVGDKIRSTYVGKKKPHNLSRPTSIINHDFGSDESQMLDRIAAWERQIQEHERISGERIADSVKCAAIQKGMPAALRTYLLVDHGQLTERDRLDGDEKEYTIVSPRNSFST